MDSAKFLGFLIAGGVVAIAGVGFLISSIEFLFIFPSFGPLEDILPGITSIMEVFINTAMRVFFILSLILIPAGATLLIIGYKMYRDHNKALWNN